MADTSDINAMLEEERIYASSQSNRTDSLKIEKNCGALVRFIPVKLGPDGTWFLRVGRHWINKRPYTCKRTSSPAIGGDPDFACPMCDMSDQYAADHDEEVSKRAKSCGGFAWWLVYCFVWKRKDANGEEFDVPRTEAFKPFTFWLKRDQWLELLDLYKRSTRKGAVALGFLDAVEGHDIWLKKDSRGILRFDREDPQPIADDEASSDKLMESIIAKAKVEDFRQLTPEKMDEALDKLEDIVLAPRSSSRSGRRAEDDDTAPAPSRGESRSRHPAENEDALPPSRGSRRSTQAEDLPPPRRAAAAPATTAALPPPRRAALPETTEPPLRRSATPPPSRSVEPPARAQRPIDPLDDPDAAEGEGDETPAEDAEAPPAVHASPPPSVRRTTAAPPPASRIEDDPDQLPDEANDPAPPITTAADSGATEVRRRPALSRLVQAGVAAAQSAGEEPPARRSRTTGGAQ